MKKIALILSITLATILLAACGNKKTEAEQFLADYEKWTDEITSVMQKVSAGDTLATAEYDKLAEKAQDFNVKLQQYGAKFTVEQMKKYEEISSKYVDALHEIPL